MTAKPSPIWIYTPPTCRERQDQQSIDEPRWVLLIMPPVSRKITGTKIRRYRGFVVMILTRENDPRANDERQSQRVAGRGSGSPYFDVFGSPTVRLHHWHAVARSARSLNSGPRL